jgi:hypothetical protein
MRVRSPPGAPHPTDTARSSATIIGRAHQRRKRIIDRPPQAELIEPRPSLVRPGAIWQHPREDAAQG